MSWFAGKNQLFLGSLVNQLFRFRTCHFLGLNALAGSKVGSGTKTGMEPCRCESPNREESLNPNHFF